MQSLLLNLDGTWALAQYESERLVPREIEQLRWLDAQVPGSVHHALHLSGALENPLASSAATTNAQWVSKKNWLYRRTFSLEPAMLRASQVEVQLDGVDTYADVWINGHFIGCTDDMFRRWRFPVDPCSLRPETNELLIHLKSHGQMVADMVDLAAPIAVSSSSTAHLERSLIRRYQRSYNDSLLNLGQPVVGIGIPQPVRLQFGPPVMVRYACLVTDALDSHSARAHVEVELSRAEGEIFPVMVELSLTESGSQQAVAAAKAEVRDCNVCLPITIPAPRLWWPRGYGQAHLYTLTVRLSRAGETVHTFESRVGIKQIELITETPDGRPDFHLQVNGRRMFVRGGNLMPLDAIQGAGSLPAYERLLNLVAHANMNLVRIWGGGTTETEEFLTRCDELGIMLWQDFFFHSCTYPDHLDAFVAKVEREAIDLIRTMRPHASLVMLCGGNEQQQGWDEWHWKLHMDRFYGSRIFSEILPRIATDRAPEIPYIPNSPHGGRWGQSPTKGDTHTWGSYYNATKDPLFVTETCWHLDSYSRPETLAEAIDLNVTAPEWSESAWDDHWQERTGLGLFTKYPYSAYHDAGSLAEYLHGLEIEQLEADYHALSLLRVRSPSCSGIIYWPLNKGGPLFGFGAIDYAQRPLMGHYGLRRIFADVVLSVYRDAGTVRILGANDSLESIDAELRVLHLDVAGQVLGRWVHPAPLKAGMHVGLLDLPDLYGHVKDRTRELVYAELVVHDHVVARDRLLFCPLSEVVQPPADVKVAVQRAGIGHWRVHVETDTVVKLLCLSAPERVLFEDNYFTLVPQSPRTLEILRYDNIPAGLAITLQIQDWGQPVSVTLD